MTKPGSTCPLCEIIAGRAPVSLIHEDDAILAFVTVRPFAPGECTVIPRAHVDHFMRAWRGDYETAFPIRAAATRWIVTRPAEPARELAINVT